MIGDDIDDHRSLRREAAFKRRPDLARFLDTDAETTEALGNARKIDALKTPQFAVPKPRQLPVAGLVERDFLTERAVVVDDDQEVDAVAGGRLQLDKVVIEGAVAGKADHGLIGCGALDAECRRECPAERTGAANEALAVVEVDHRAGPDARVPGVAHHNAAFGQALRNFVAEALGANRRVVRSSSRQDRFAPL